MARRRDEDRLSKIIAGFALTVMLAVSVGADLVHSKLVYHNYRCAFAHCRVLVNP